MSVLGAWWVGCFVFMGHGFVSMGGLEGFLFAVSGQVLRLLYWYLCRLVI